MATDSTALDRWCRTHLGAGVRRELFRSGWFSEVLGVLLADGRQVVVKLRQPSPRLEACWRVHQHAHLAGVPSPRPLLGPTPFPPDGVATVEEHLTPQHGQGTSEASAELLARVVTHAQVDLAPGRLSPPPAWVHWDHDEGGLWPQPDDAEVDLDATRVDWIDALAEGLRDLLRADASPDVIGHADWVPSNVWWAGDGAAHAVHDWDSVVALPEAALAGVGAALHRDACTVEQSAAFWSAYERARSPWTGADRQVGWAAGLWVLLFDAKKDLLAGRTPQLTEEQARRRFRLATATVGP